MRPDRLAIAMLALGLAGCATTQFDRLYEARRFADAARTFDADSSLHTDERAIFRAALVRATPGSPAYQPDIARTLLERLLALHPGSSHREEASRILALLLELRRLEDQVAWREEEIGRLDAEIERLRGRIAWLENQFELQQDLTSVLRQIVSRLEDDLRHKERELAALEDALNRLKAIDLRPTGRDDEEPASGVPGQQTNGPDETRRGPPG